VNPRNLKNPTKDMFWIALAGPMSNILLAILAVTTIALLIRHGMQIQFADTLIKILATFTATNLFLAVFNMIPLHPLDGGKVLARFLPRELNYKLEQNEHITGMVLMVLIFTGALSILAYPVRELFMWSMMLAGVPL